MIKKVRIQDLAAIADFAPESAFTGVNVILGKNDMCKTILMKMLYAICKSSESFAFMTVNSPVTRSFDAILAAKLQGVYGRNVNGLGDLVRKNGAPHRLSVHAEMDGGMISMVDFSFGSDTRTVIKDCTPTMTPLSSSMNAIYVPANEVVTAFAAIKAIAKQYHFPGYDDTTLDLIDLLDIPVTTESMDFEDVSNRIKTIFGGELKQVNKNERFVFHKSNNDFRMHLTAEGVKHMGVLATLINNGTLRKGTVLFLDEPENNLHPYALREVVKAIMKLSELGVQIFLTTHNYFVLKQLQIESVRMSRDVTCCSLSRNSDTKIVEARFSNLREGVPTANDIVEESLKMYNEDIYIVDNVM